MKGKHAYRDWKALVKVHLNMSAGAVCDVITQQVPNLAFGGNLVTWHRNNAIANLYSVLFLNTSRGWVLQLCGITRARNRNMDSEMGKWQTLEEQYDAFSSATCQELYDELAKIQKQSKGRIQTTSCTS